ncbi:hypothetical protein AB205_0083430 [Aquarana catesbeiana]|uniref:Uncharacterized protein n=1 Tax=Aquarana catesbeiana TaxID=8400 RepID=A0A2G9R5F4_AQUCT|nr:hypothetical protein AB205_0083430 [Aquarana catesbeiana]
MLASGSYSIEFQRVFQRGITQRANQNSPPWVFFTTTEYTLISRLVYSLERESKQQKQMPRTPESISRWTMHDSVLTRIRIQLNLECLLLLTNS